MTGKRNIKLVLADDHEIVLEGLGALLEKQGYLGIVAKVTDGLEAVHAVQRQKPDLVIMDVTMKGMNGIEATRRIKKGSPGTRVLCLSMHAAEQFVAGVLDAGASGYLLKDCAFEELHRAIAAVMGGDVYLSPAIAKVALTGMRHSELGDDASLKLLTGREREVLQLTAEGVSTKNIAERMHVSVKTVATHRERAMSKLNLKSIADVTKYAIREGLTSAD